MNVTTNQTVFDLLADLRRQNVGLSVTGGENLRVTGELTESQRYAVRQLKPQIINAIRAADIPHAVATENRNEKDYFFETRGAIESYRPAESISGKLDALIGKGAAFDVAEDDFIVTGAENLNESERRYLDFNKAPVLCTLQQRLLVKYLLFDSAELLNDFAVEIYERESIQAEETGFYTYDTYFAAVNEVTEKWFVQLLDSAELKEL